MERILRKLLIGMTIFLLTVGGFSVWFFSSKSTTIVYENDDYTVSLQSPSAMKIRHVDVQKREIEGVVDTTHAFDVALFGKRLGTYSIVERTLGNDTVFLFERLENDGFMKLSLNSELVFQDEVQLADKSWNPEVIEHPYHDVFGVDPTVNPYGRITASTDQQTIEMIAGHVFVSKKLTQAYDSGKISRLRELDKEISDVTVEGAVVSKPLTVGGGKTAESWVLLSKEALFSSEEEEDDYIEFALHNQASQLNWLTIDGPYTKLPFSIDPSTKLGYGRAIGRIEDDVALEWHRKSESIFFESMVLNSRTNLLTYIEEFDGTRWPTEYTSTWLSNAYGVKAPYVDTRYNEYVAFFLDQTAVEFADDVANASLYVPVYADYLLSRIDDGEIIETDEGYLIVDYFDEDPETPITHASLNHELGGLKILLTAYDNTGDEKYMTAAESVISGIESFGKADGGWIRDNGDLWYQARPDGDFSGDDYPQLTLVDLLETQQLLAEMDLPRNAYFDELIDAKLGFLADEEIELIEKVTRLMD